jgi:hypothetical protein
MERLSILFKKIIPIEIKYRKFNAFEHHCGPLIIPGVMEMWPIGTWIP